MTDDLSARRLQRYGLRRGAYDGANRRRFVLFMSNGNTEIRREFDTKVERDNYARSVIASKITATMLVALHKASDWIADAQLYGYPAAGVVTIPSIIVDAIAAAEAAGITKE